MYCFLGKILVTCICFCLEEDDVAPHFCCPPQKNKADACILLVNIILKVKFFFGIWSRKVAQSCQTLCDPMDCSLPGSSVHGIFQARVLEWIAISFSRGSSWLRDWTQVSRIAGRRFTGWATKESESGISSKCSLKFILLRKFNSSMPWKSSYTETSNNGNRLLIL